MELVRHCEERSDEAIQPSERAALDCFADARNDGGSQRSSLLSEPPWIASLTLAMTAVVSDPAF
jgi:hypothetical protein